MLSGSVYLVLYPLISLQWWMFCYLKKYIHIIFNAEATNHFCYAIKTLQYVGKEKLTSPQFV